MKKTMILMTSSLYLMDLAFILVGIINEPATGEILAYMFFIFLVLSFVVSIINIILAILNRYKSGPQIYKETMIFKIILIPHYLFAFICSVFLFIGSVFSVLTLIFMMAFVPLFIFAILINVFSYIIMVSTSSYVIFRLFNMRKKKKIIFVIVHIILELIFVADLFDSVYLYSYFKNEEQKLVVE